MVFSLFAVRLFFYFGIDKVSRDSQKDEVMVARDSTKNVKIDSLKNEVIDLSHQINRDRLGNDQFEERLDSMFHIIRDSSNRPILHNTYNTRINKARDVFIGND